MIYLSRRPVVLKLVQLAGLRVVRRGRFLVESDRGLAARLEVGRGAIVVNASPGEPVVQ